MRNETLYKFLTTKFKENNLPIESLPSHFGFSRSSLYRYMKGISSMSSEIQSQFISILNLSEAEQLEFKNLVRLSEFDGTIIAARKAIDNFVFSNNNSKKAPILIKFAYHENDVFLRTSDEICQLLFVLSEQNEATCTLRIINCMGGGIIELISTCLEKLFLASKNINVEHLLSFSEKDHLHNTNTLIQIIPLLKYEKYSVLYSHEPTHDKAKPMFDNAVFIDIKCKDEPSKYFVISFLDKDLSTCLATSDKNVFDFFIDNYEALKMSYHAALLDASSLDLFGSQIAELQENSNCYVLKPNCCYDTIPISVYQSLLERTTPKELENVKKGILGQNFEIEDGLENIFSTLEKRISSSYVNQHIDVYSMQGLSQFARTGRTTDHFVFLPSFNELERKTTLEYIRDRHNDPDDLYELYITQDIILDNGYIIVVLDGIGILIEYNQDEYLNGVCSNLFINNKMLADVFSDYIRNHLPKNHTLSASETTIFLESLIAAL